MNQIIWIILYKLIHGCHLQLIRYVILLESRKKLPYFVRIKAIQKKFCQFYNIPSQCECNTPSHLYQPYCRVIAGDLSVIPNSKFRDLIAKGPKYRETCKVDWDKNLSLLCEAVDQYALQWAKREMVELSVLSSWKEMVKGQIEERISKLKHNSNNPLARCCKMLT